MGLKKIVFNNIIIPLGGIICVAVLIRENDTKLGSVLFGVLIGMQIMLIVDGIVKMVKSR